MRSSQRTKGKKRQLYSHGPRNTTRNQIIPTNCSVTKYIKMKTKHFVTLKLLLSLKMYVPSSSVYNLDRSQSLTSQAKICWTFASIQSHKQFTETKSKTIHHRFARKCDLELINTWRHKNTEKNVYLWKFIPDKI